jgi:hypothetical protein
MVKRVLATVCISAAIVGAAAAQAKKPAGTKSVLHELTVTADSVYTGTMELAVDAGKVTGNMHVTAPTEITGKVAGTAKAGVLTLEFPYLMVERNCEGTVKMNIKMPAKPGLATGTMEAVGCGESPTDKVTGTVELKPAAPKAAK